jgi:hypothetical protein
LKWSWKTPAGSEAQIVAPSFLYGRRAPHKKEALVAKKTKKKAVARREYTKEDLKLLKSHSKSKTPVDRIAKLMKRSGPTLRSKASAMGLPLGHRR